MLCSMTVSKSSVNDAVSVNAEVAGDFRDRTAMTLMKVMKEIETDQESNASSSEDMEFYSPKSVVAKKWPVTTMKEVNVSRNRVHNPILRIRTEESQIGEDIGECFSKFDGDGSNRVDVVTFSRPASPLSGNASASTVKSDH